MQCTLKSLYHFTTHYLPLFQNDHWTIAAMNKKDGNSEYIYHSSIYGKHLHKWGDRQWKYACSYGLMICFCCHCVVSHPNQIHMQRAICKYKMHNAGTNNRGWTEWKKNTCHTTGAIWDTTIPDSVFHIRIFIIECVWLIRHSFSWSAWVEIKEIMRNTMFHIPSVGK